MQKWALIDLLIHKRHLFHVVGGESQIAYLTTCSRSSNCASSLVCYPHWLTSSQEEDANTFGTFGKPNSHCRKAYQGAFHIFYGERRGCAIFAKNIGAEIARGESGKIKEPYYSSLVLHTE
jgi:hypothetical protein